jgi:hypothetical protein
MGGIRLSVIILLARLDIPLCTASLVTLERRDWKSRDDLCERTPDDMCERTPDDICERTPVDARERGAERELLCDPELERTEERCDSDARGDSGGDSSLGDNIRPQDERRRPLT